MCYRLALNDQPSSQIGTHQMLKCSTWSNIGDVAHSQGSCTMLQHTRTSAKHSSSQSMAHCIASGHIPVQERVDMSHQLHRSLAARLRIH